MIDNFKDTILPVLGDKRIPLNEVNNVVVALCKASYPYLNPEDYASGSLMNEVTSPIERLSYYVLDVIFDISERKIGPSNVVPTFQQHLVERCNGAFERYYKDRLIRNDYPLSRLVIAVLKNILYLTYDDFKSILDAEGMR